MRIQFIVSLVALLAVSSAGADADGVKVSVSFNDRLGPMAMNQFALGQGGLSVEPMWDSRIAEIGALKPKIIRLFVQEYFTFKLLSRLTGDRLRLTTSDGRIHGFAARDDRYRAYRYNLMLWNFSSSTTRVALTLEDMPGAMTAKPIILDATTPSQDEIARLTPQNQFKISLAQPTLELKLEPYQIRFWSFEP